MNKVTPFLWFNGEAEEAANYYVSLIPNSRITNVNRHGPDGPAFLVAFELDGRPFMALNGGPKYTLTEAISLFVNCQSQQDVDELWEKLSAGGEKGRCGWLKDRYGLSWQIIPTALMRLMGDPDPAKSQRVMQAILAMDKIDIAALQRAYDGV